MYRDMRERWGRKESKLSRKGKGESEKEKRVEK